MRKSLMIIMFLLASLVSGATDQKVKWTPRQKAEFNRIHQLLQPQMRADLTRAISRFAQLCGPLDHQSDPEAVVRQVVAGLVSPGLDLDSLAFYVLAQTARSADSDLKSLIDEIEKMNRAKQTLRDYIQQLRQMIANAESAGQGKPRPAFVLPVPGAVPPPADPCRPARTLNLRIPYCRAPEIEPLPDIKNWTAAQLRSRLERYLSQLKTLVTLIRHNGIIVNDASEYQARLFQIMSNFLKAVHDARRASIRNVK